ncbi:MAG: propanoyl-CoA acyltransferase [bacterium]
MREVAVLGVGMTKFGKTEKTSVEIFAEAAVDAVRESGVRRGDIQALFLGNVLGDFEEGQMNMAAFCAAEVGLGSVPATRFEGACASATLALISAYVWVASGRYDVVLAGGTERATVMGTPLATRTFAMGQDSRYESSLGLTFPGVFGMMCHQYSHKYGVPLAKLKEQMAAVAVKNHDNGLMNPKAHLRRKITVETVLDPEKSPMVADPLQLYDCCPFSDGAAALVLACGDAARRLHGKPVWVAGVGQGSAGALYRQKDLTIVTAREEAARQAYRQAGLRPEDIDVCELHDCFTIAEIVATECLGFFPYGTGGDAAERGRTRIGGGVPVNPSGGLKSKGHPIGATGVAQAVEIAQQLRGECGERQVDGARTGMIDTLGGDLGTVCSVIFRS